MIGAWQEYHAQLLAIWFTMCLFHLHHHQTPKTKKFYSKLLRSHPILLCIMEMKTLQIVSKINLISS